MYWLPSICPFWVRVSVRVKSRKERFLTHTDGDSLAFLTYISGAHVQHPFVLVSRPTIQNLYEWAISQLNNCYYSGAYSHYPLITKAFSRKSFHTRAEHLRALRTHRENQSRITWSAYILARTTQGQCISFNSHKILGYWQNFHIDHWQMDVLVTDTDADADHASRTNGWPA